MLELKSVGAGYGAFQALFDISLDVRHGEAVAVIGPNGAGKTTLMRSRSRERMWAPRRRTRSSVWASRTCRRTGACFRA
jgi:ABC-type cobalamin/Fe3+-siderophores transport system ATPase subunit